jgi:hypothetical protein
VAHHPPSLLGTSARSLAVGRAAGAQAHARQRVVSSASGSSPDLSSLFRMLSRSVAGEPEGIINLKSAKALGLTVPLILQMTVDEVID